MYEEAILQAVSANGIRLWHPFPFLQLPKANSYTMNKDYLEGKTCVKCDQPAVKINGVSIPVCAEHDMEKPNFLKDMRDAIGYSVI